MSGKQIAIEGVVSAFMQAQGAAGERMKCLVQVSLDGINAPPQIDNSKVGQTAPGGHTIMPTIQRSIHEAYDARVRVKQLFDRMQAEGMATDARQALFASGLDVTLTRSQLQVVSAWNDLVGQIGPSTDRYVLAPVPKHWIQPPATS